MCMNVACVLKHFAWSIILSECYINTVHFPFRFAVMTSCCDLGDQWNLARPTSASSFCFLIRWSFFLLFNQEKAVYLFFYNLCTASVCLLTNHWMFWVRRQSPLPHSYPNWSLQNWYWSRSPLGSELDLDSQTEDTPIPENISKQVRHTHF